MKTLVFCTSFASSKESWERREAMWIKAIERSNLHFDQLLIIDDGSAFLPAWPNVPVIRETDVAEPKDLECAAPILVYTHEKRLGRASVFEFPGWHRSFAFGVLYGASHGFEKIIHIESDAFLTSKRIQDHFNRATTGWFSVWCETYQFPEIAIQLAAGPDIDRMVAFVKEPYEKMAGRNHETLFPFTHLERIFVGNRYGEMIGHVPRYADYSAQTHTGQPDSFYWWISGGRGDNPEGRTSVMMLYPPFAAEMLAGSWSGSEPCCSWMLHFDSSLFFPAVAQGGEHEIELDLNPCIYRHMKQQRLYIFVNDRLINAVTLYTPAIVTSVIPAGVLNVDRSNEIRFFHPDSFAPSEIDGHQEERHLSVAINSLKLFKTDRA